MKNIETGRIAVSFFERVGFAPRLRELEAERDDVHLVLADRLA